MPDANGFVTWVEAYENNHKVIMFLKSVPADAQIFIEGRPELTIHNPHQAAEILQTVVEAMGRA